MHAHSFIRFVLFFLIICTASQFSTLLSSIRPLRDNVIAYISSVLNGDSLAAEYVLLSLVSRV